MKIIELRSVILYFFHMPLSHFVKEMYAFVVINYIKMKLMISSGFNLERDMRQH